MATAEAADAYLQQVHSARTHLQACYRRAHEILTVSEADLLRQLDDIQTSYEQETKSREEEMQDLEKSKLFLKTSLQDNDTLNIALSPLTDKLEQIRRLASAARTVRFQWNTAFEDNLRHVGEIITTSSVPAAVIPQPNLTPGIPQHNLTPSFPQPISTPVKRSISRSKFRPPSVKKSKKLLSKKPDISNSIDNNAFIIMTPSIPQTSISQPNLTPSIPQTSISPPNLTPSIPQTSISQPNLTPSIPQTSISQLNLTPSIPQASISQPNLTPSIPDYRNKSRPVISCCKQGTDSGQLMWPEGLAIEPQSGRIFIADSGNNRVQVYSPDGEYCFSTHMDWPNYICIYNNTVYVSQLKSDCITLYKLDGEYINKKGSKGTSNGKFKFPSGIAISATSEHIYVCDTGNNRVQIFNKSLNFHSQFGKNFLYQLRDIKLSNDSVIVLDAGNPCIHIFSITNFSLLNSIISRGTAADAQIGHSCYFTMDAGLNLILTDKFNHCIRVFSKTGDFITQIGREGHAIGEFTKPAGIAIDRQNRIIVVSDNKNCSLQIF